MLKKISVFALGVFFVGLPLFVSSNAQAGTFFDDFNDGNADGWWLGCNHHNVYGTWRIEGGVMLEDQNGDHFVATVDNIFLSDQVVETDVKTGGYGGVVFWYQSQDRWVSVSIYPYSAGIHVIEFIDGAGYGSDYGFRTWHSTWYNLKVEANNETGELDVYLDDVYLFTYQTITPYRSGQSGLFSGNGGSYFDNFQVTAEDISPLSVSIDIKPGSDPNCFNQNGRGVIPVAVFGSTDLDVTQILVGSLSLQGLAVKMAGKSGKYLAHYDYINADDYLDLVLQFMDSNSWVPSSGNHATLTGELIDGTLIEGSDTICIVP